MLQTCKNFDFEPFGFENYGKEIVVLYLHELILKWISFGSRPA